MKKILIEVTELEQGGFVAHVNDSKLNATDGYQPSTGEPIYAEHLPGKKGLIHRVGQRLIEFFEEEGRHEH